MTLTRASKRIIGAVGATGLVAAAILALRPPPIPVEIAPAAAGDLRVTVEGEGKTRVRDRYVVSVPAAGRLYRIALKEGDGVAEGDVVARLEPLPLDERTRAQARANLEAAQAARRAAEARVRQVRESLAQAVREHRRADELAGGGLASPAAREQAELAQATRARELDAARFSAREAAFEAEAARAVLLADEPGAAPGTGIGIRSPVAGRVLRVVEPNERSIPAGTPIVEVGDPSAIEVVVDLLSTDAVRVAPGMAMTIEGGEGRLLPGRVRLIEPSAFTKVSALGVEEQRVNVVGDLEASPGRLGDGYRVETAITLWEGRNVLKIPSGALFRSGPDWAVFVLEGGRARRRIVATGHRGTTEVEITRGLVSAETVILHPSDRIADGVRARAATTAR